MGVKEEEEGALAFSRGLGLKRQRSENGSRWSYV